MKKLLVKIIQGILWCIDKDHRNKEYISMDNMKKFTHIQPQDFKGDDGKIVSAAFRTVPYKIWQLKTDTKELLAADKHRVIKENGDKIWMEDLKIGDKLITDNGIETVRFIKNLGIRTHCYCISIEGELFYGNGILGNNTTTASAYLLWRAMFVPDSTILVTANKYVQAIEILDRVRWSYENLPDFIRAGVTVYNRGSITFDNGSRIISRATSANSSRGLSISLLYCLSGNSGITVRDKITGEIKDITLKELHEELE